MSVNLVVLVGNMTADPERRYSPTNIPIATFGLAINKPGRRDDRDKPPLFIDVQCWDKLADQVYDYGRRGRRVYVQGELVTDKWEDQDGGKRSKTYIKAVIVRWLDSNKDESSSDDDRGRDDRGSNRRDRDDRDDRGRGRDRDSRRDERPRRDEEPRSRSNARDDDAPPPDDRDRRDTPRDKRPDDDLPF